MRKREENAGITQNGLPKTGLHDLDNSISQPALPQSSPPPPPPPPPPPAPILKPETKLPRQPAPLLSTSNPSAIIQQALPEQDSQKLGFTAKELLDQMRKLRKFGVEEIASNPTMEATQQDAPAKDSQNPGSTEKDSQKKGGLKKDDAEKDKPNPSNDELIRDRLMSMRPGIADDDSDDDDDDDSDDDDYKSGGSKANLSDSAKTTTQPTPNTEVLPIIKKIESTQLSTEANNLVVAEKEIEQITQAPETLDPTLVIQTQSTPENLSKQPPAPPPAPPAPPSPPPPPISTKTPVAPPPPPAPAPDSLSKIAPKFLSDRQGLIESAAKLKPVEIKVQSDAIPTADINIDEMNRIRSEFDRKRQERPKQQDEASQVRVTTSTSVNILTQGTPAKMMQQSREKDDGSDQNDVDGEDWDTSDAPSPRIFLDVKKKPAINTSNFADPNSLTQQERGVVAEIPKPPLSPTTEEPQVVKDLPTLVVDQNIEIPEIRPEILPITNPNPVKAEQRTLFSNSQSELQEKLAKARQKAEEVIPAAEMPTVQKPVITPLVVPKLESVKIDLPKISVPKAAPVPKLEIPKFTIQTQSQSSLEEGAPKLRKRGVPDLFLPSLSNAPLQKDDLIENAQEELHTFKRLEKNLSELSRSEENNIVVEVLDALSESNNKLFSSAQVTDNFFVGIGLNVVSSEGSLRVGDIIKKDNEYLPSRFKITENGQRIYDQKAVENIMKECEITHFFENGEWKEADLASLAQASRGSFNNIKLKIISAAGQEYEVEAEKKIRIKENGSWRDFDLKEDLSKIQSTKSIDSDTPSNSPRYAVAENIQQKEASISESPGNWVDRTRDHGPIGGGTRR